MGLYDCVHVHHDIYMNYTIYVLTEGVRASYRTPFENTAEEVLLFPYQSAVAAYIFLRENLVPFGSSNNLRHCAR